MSNYDLNDANAFFRARMAYTTGVHELEGGWERWEVGRYAIEQEAA